MDSIPLENQRFLAPPPTQTLPVTSLTNDEKDFILYGLKILDHLKKQLEEFHGILEVEIATLSTFIYKHHNRFRNDKGFKYLKILAKCVNRYQEMKLPELCSNYNSSMPLKIDVQICGQSKKVYFPTKQMLQYFLVRLRGACTLLAKMTVLSENAGDLLVKRLHLGHFWGLALNNMAVVSRIWKVSITSMVLVSQSYERLVKLAENLLPESPVLFLPENYVLPSTLICPDNDELLEKAKQALPDEYFPKFSPTLKSEDTFGTIIKRTNIDEITSSVEPKEEECGKKQKQWTRIVACVDKLKNKQDVVNFIHDETQNRKINRKKSVTKSMEQNQWKELRNTLKGIVQNISTSNKKKEKQKWLSSAREKIICWALFPSLKGEKPNNFNEVCSNLSGNKEPK